MSLQARRQAGKVDNTPFHISCAFTRNFQSQNLCFEQVFRHGILTSSPIFSHNQPCGSSTRTGRSKLLHELLWCQPSPFDAAELVFREARSAIYMLCACLHFQSLSIWRGWVTTRTYWGDDHVTLPPRVSSSCNGRQHTTPLTFAL